jgi:hypothetical protein
MYMLCIGDLVGLDLFQKNQLPDFDAVTHRQMASASDALQALFPFS